MSGVAAIYGHNTDETDRTDKGAKTGDLAP